MGLGELDGDEKQQNAADCMKISLLICIPLIVLL
jgi:hypothetical protein